MKIPILPVPLLLTFGLSASCLNAQLLVTEIQSDGTSDYWELTNTGSAAVNLGNYKWNDSARSLAGAVVIPGGSSIAAGESVIFTATPAATFRTLWGISNSVQIFGDASAPGFGKDDAITLYDAEDAEVFFLSYAKDGFSNAGGGHAGSSAGGAAGQAMIWDPTSGTAPPRYTNATGANFNTVSAPGGSTDKGSPGYSGFVPPVDLGNYVRIGRYDLPEPRRTALPAGTPEHNVLCQEASGVAYNWDTDSLFIVGDGGKSVTQVSKSGELIDTMTLAPGTGPQGTDFYDPEGVTYMGGGQFVFTEERDRQFVKFTYVAGTTLSRGDTQTVKLGTFVDNIGLEGISYDPQTGGFICVKELSPIGIFQTDIDFAAGTATNGSATTENSTDLFDPALLGMTDVADVFVFSNFPAMAGQPQAGNLLVLGQEDARVVNVDRAGHIYSTLTIAADAGSPLPVAAQQHEGITMDRTGRIYIVNENGGGDIDHPQLWVYAPAVATNLPPTAVVLDNAVNAIEENTSTASPVKVGDIAVTDDGLGSNVPSLSGVDSGSFEIAGTGLYLKAGTVLDFENKTSYSVTLNVDDTTVGTTPDATVDFTLSVIDQTTETPPPPALIISEVTPWASTVANSPLGADWFEVTNVSDAAVNIAGWKVDDSTPTFATAVALNGITSIAPGESVIFIETADLAGKSALFKSNWFGVNPPAGLQIGNYTGSGIGLGSGGDALSLYNASGVIQATVTFGTSPAAAPFTTFDNTAGINNGSITAMSAAGVHGAFAATNSPNEIGSPGYSAPGILKVTEVAPWSSGNSPVGADWFEVTNRGARAVDLTGWKVDDSSESPAAARALTGISSIAPGESVIFLETANLGNTRSSFLSNWFGENPPAGLQVGGYGGLDIGLSTGGDAVNLYDSTGARRANVSFGASSSRAPFTSFDNTAGADVAAITLKSVPEVNGAFAAANDVNEIASPGIATAGGPLDFALWLSAKGYSSRGLGSDTDGDGLTDSLEYFFNQSPNNGGDLSHMPQVVSSGGPLELDFIRLTDTGSLAGVFEVSGDLATWSAGVEGIDYEVVSSTVNGDETAFSYALPGTGPSAPGISEIHNAPHLTPVAGASLGGIRIVNEGLVGAGRIGGETLDSFGETMGASSGLFITDWAWDGSEFSGKFQVLPDRGYNSGTIFSNYAARLHRIDFTFRPYHGAGPVAQGQIIPSYVSTEKFTYLDGGTMKFTTGLNAIDTGTLFGQSVGTVPAANGPGGIQENLLSFDAEAVYLFPDGSGYVSDEYGAYIARFNPGKQITGITQLPEAARPHRPADTLNFDSINAPTNGRRNNQGLEGLSVTPDGTRLFALLQSATVQDTNGGQQQTRTNARLFVYDIAGENREAPVIIGEYVVKLPKIDLDGNGSGADGTAAQSEIVAIGGNAFLMLPRDGNGLGKGTAVPATFKSVQLVDFSSATNILGLYDGAGEQISPSGVLRPEIDAAATAEIINMLNPADLAKFGFNTNNAAADSNTLNEKIEGMALVPDLSTPQENDFFLFVGNDNDFQSPDVKMLDAEGNVVSYGDGRLNAGVTNDTTFYAYRITIDTKRFFRFSVK